MSYRCCLCTDKETTHSDGEKVHYFGFPTHKKYRAIWVALMRKLIPDFEPRTYHKICSRHFESYICTENWSRLFTGTIPTLHLPAALQQTEKTNEDLDDMEVEFADDPELGVLTEEERAETDVSKESKEEDDTSSIRPSASQVALAALHKVRDLTIKPRKMDEIDTNVVCRCCLNANKNQIKEYFDMKTKIFYSNQQNVNVYESYCEITGFSAELYPNIPPTETNICDICLVQLQIAYAFRDATRLANITLNQQSEMVIVNNAGTDDNSLIGPMQMDPQSFTVIQDDEAFSIQLLDSDADEQPDPVVLVDESEPESVTVAEDESSRTSLSGNNEEGVDFHKCHICYILFWDKAELKEHCISLHNGDRFKCEKCQKTFSVQTYYKRHVARKESCQILKCTSCSIVFNSSSERDDHMKEHAVKQYKCKICNMQISSQRGASEHRARHKAQPKPRPFCTICDCEFDTRSRLQDHRQQTHPEAAVVDTYNQLCRICPEKFATKTLLHRHMRQHQHKCGKCQKIFSSYGLLREHRDEKHTMHVFG